MINILPPDLKAQINYSKQNVRLLKYVFLALIIGSTLIALLVGAMWYGDRQINNLQETLSSKQQARQSYKEMEQRVDTLQSNLVLIEKLFTEQNRYSALLKDLAAALPAGSYINQMSLLGDESKPLEILITTDTFERAAEVRNALVASARIKNADIQSISEGEEGGFRVAIVAAFEPGAAR